MSYEGRVLNMDVLKYPCTFFPPNIESSSQKKSIIFIVSFCVLLMFVLVNEILIYSFHVKILTIVHNNKKITTICFVVLTIFNILHINGTKVKNINSIAFHYMWCSLIFLKISFFKMAPIFFHSFLWHLIRIDFKSIHGHQWWWIGNHSIDILKMILK